MRVSKFEDLSRPSPYGLRISWGDGTKTRKFFKTKGDRNAWERDELQQFIRDRESKSPSSGKATLSVALALWLISCEKRNLRPTSISSNEWRVNKMISHVGDIAVSEMTRDLLMHFIQSANTESTRSNLRGTCVTFLRWCARPCSQPGCEHPGMGGTPQMWLDIKWDKIGTDEAPPEILTIKEVEALMLELPERYRPAQALGLFTGIRGKGELSRLDYSMIDWGNCIKVPGSVAKTRKLRIIHDLPPNLWTWLPKRKRGLVMPSYRAFVQSRRRAARRCYGWKQGTSQKSGFDYPYNAARHSFATYGYWRGMEWAMRTMGHMNYNTFQKNYCNAGVSEADSKEYFSITAE